MAQPRKNERPIERVADQSPDVREELLEALRAVAPEAFTENRLDLDKLGRLISGPVEVSTERYALGWAGKRDAVSILQLPSRATLIPDSANSVKFGDSHHVFIQGENLETLKLLYRSYYGRIKLIYLDPPYNTGNEPVYPDNFADPLDTYLRVTGQKSETGDYLTTKTERNGRIHSSWLSMMYPRLAMARQLLRDDGLIFVSIDGKELHNLIFLMNEIFGEENQIGYVVWKGATDNNPTQIAIEHEYILCFARNKPQTASAWSNTSDIAKEAILSKYRELKEELGNDVEALQGLLRAFITANREQLTPLTHYNRVDEDGVYTGSRKVHNPHPGGYFYDVIHPKTGKPCEPPVNGYRYPEETMKELLSRGKILFGDDDTQIIQIKEYLEEYSAKFSSVITLDSRSGSNELKALFGGKKVFDNPKPTALLKDIFGFVLGEDDIALDFFAGSASSAHAIIDMNHADGGRRQSISVQFPEPVPPDSIAAKEGFKDIAEIGRARLRNFIAQSALLAPGNDGFRAFDLAESNVRRWAGVETKDADAYADQLDAFTDTLVDGWKPENVIWEVALREGYPLTARIEKREVDGQTIWRVTDPERGQSFHICLDDTLSVEAVSSLGLRREDLFICRDKALDDTLAANLALQCRLKVL